MISFCAAISHFEKDWQWNPAFVTAGHLCQALFDAKGLEVISFSAAILACKGCWCIAFVAAGHACQ
eukprot:11356132-Karenia_brevis.AAC.1